MTPDRLTPEERDAHGRVGTPYERYGDSKILAAALDRLAPQPAPDPDREAREALDGAMLSVGRFTDHGTGREAGTTLTALRAHGFAHRSEGAREAEKRGEERAIRATLQAMRTVLGLSITDTKDDQVEMAAREHLAAIARPVAPSPAAVDVVREAAEAATTSFGAHWCGDSEWLRSFTAALAARGVTFGGTT